MAVYFERSIEQSQYTVSIKWEISSKDLMIENTVTYLMDLSLNVYEMAWGKNARNGLEQGNKFNEKNARNGLEQGNKFNEKNARNGLEQGNKFNGKNTGQTGVNEWVINYRLLIITSFYSACHPQSPYLIYSSHPSIIIHLFASDPITSHKMTTLWILPNELLLNIINEVLPDDIENFSQTCRTIHALSTNALRTHAARKKKYSKLTLHLCGPQDYNRHPLFLIRDILMDSRIAYYPVEVHFADSFTNVAMPQNDDQDHKTKEELKNEVRSISSVFQAKLFSLVRNYPYADSWKEGINMHSKPALLSLLLTMLPNVQRMIIHSSYQLPRLHYIIDRISRVHYTPSSDLPTRIAPNKLSEVSITDGTRGLGMPAWLSLALWEQFTVLPSMHSFHAEFFRGGLREGPPKDESVDQLVPLACKPSLREIRLESSIVTARDFESMLTGVTALQRFTYSHAAYRVWPGEWAGPTPFEPKAMVEILQSNAKSTLVHLDLTWQPRHTSSDEAHFIGSLRAFTALKRIRVNVDMFARSTPPTFASCQPEALVDVLPASAEQLELVSYIKDDEVTALLAGLPERKAERVPSLQCITFQKSGPLSVEMLACHQSGITVTLLELFGNGH